MPNAGLDDLHAFATVAKLRSFTRSAAALGTSTSDLSHTVRRLEARLGCRLLERNSRSVSPSEAGVALLATLAPALDDITSAVARLGASKDRATGTLRLTTTRQAYEQVIRPVLPAFISDHPDVVVEVLIDCAFRDIVANRFDASIRLSEKIERDMIALKVGPDLSMAVVASPDYVSRNERITHSKDLLRHRCINYRMEKAHTLYAWEFEREDEIFEARVTGPLTFKEPELMLEAALDGLGVGYLLDHETAPYMAAGRLVRLLDDWTPPFPGSHLYYSSRWQMRPALGAFISALRGQAVPSHV